MRFEEMVMSKRPEYRHLQRVSFLACGLLVGVIAENISQRFNAQWLPVGLMALSFTSVVMAGFNRPCLVCLDNEGNKSHENF